MPTRYRTDGSGAVLPRPLVVGERLKFDGDRLWWTVRAVSEHFAALTSHAKFEPAGTRCYTVIDWRNGVRGPCNRIGQGWGDGAFTEEQCAEMLAEFEGGRLEVSQRNWVPIRFGVSDARERED
jgi:hypothetical protein